MSGTGLNTTGLKITFDDEFNSFVASANGSIGWTTHLPFGGTSERSLPANGDAEYYADSTTGINPFSIQNGLLNIAATLAPAGSNPANLPYNSGAITSINSASQTYGLFEIRCKLPVGAGLLSAFWLEPTNGLAQSELDGFEIMGSNPSQIFETTHQQVGGVFTQDLQITNAVNSSTGFHTYAIDWEPTTVTWYIDGQEVNTAPTPSSANTPMDMIVNLAVGDSSSWEGAPSSSAEFPASLQVAWIRSYASANTVSVSGDEAILPGTGTASVSGQVVYSNNGAPATAVAGYDVTLVNASTGNIVANALTNSQGSYDFTGLAAGTYELQYLPPPGEAAAAGGPANVATNQTASIILATGQSITAATQMLINAPCSIQGQVLYATSSAGMALSGIVVTLLNSAGSVLQTTTTDSSGNYGFTYLYAGSYQVAYAVPAGDQVAAGGPANTSTYVSGLLTLTVGEALALTPEIVIPPGGSLTGQIQSSAGGSGGAGVGGVPVELLDAGGSIVLTTTTNSSGFYLFTSLNPGTYATRITAPAGSVLALGGPANATTGATAPVSVAADQAVLLPTEQLLTQPATITGPITFEGGGYWKMVGMTVDLLSSTGAVLTSTVTNGVGTFTFSDVAAGTYQLDYILPSNAKFYSGYENFTTGLSSPLTVSAGQTLTMTNVGVEAITTSFINGSVLTKSGSGAASGLAGVTVSMLTSAGVWLISTTTSSTGSFQFKGMLPGGYEIEYTLPSGDAFLAGGPANTATGLSVPIAVTAGQVINLAGETLVAASSSTATLGGSVIIGGTADAGVSVSLESGGTILASAFTGSTGAFAFGGLAAGAYQVQYSAGAAQSFGSGPASGATGLTAAETLAAGQTLTLGAEALIVAPGTVTGSVTYAAAPDAGVKVSLLNEAGASVASTTTASDGSFLFAGIAAGQYQVQYSATAAQLFGSGPANLATGIAAPISVGAGQIVTLETEALLAVPAGIGGSVTYQGAADPGAEVWLIGAGGATLASTSTGSGGAFAFGDLTPAVYQIRYADPAGEMFASCPASSSTGLTPSETLTAGETLTLAAENLAPAPAILAGSVTYNGAADAGSEVSLIGAGSTIVATAATGSSGNFAFTGLAAGVYEIEYSEGPAQVFVAGPANLTSGLTPHETLVAGETLTLAAENLGPAPAAITGSVTYASAALSGAHVALIGAGGTTLATATTSSSGVFGFTNLTAGIYEIQYSDAAGQIFASGPANGTTGLTAGETLVAGQTLTLAMEALAPAPASIAGTVIYQGVADAGLTVALLNASGVTQQTTTTGGNGNFVFSSLAAGIYEVQYSDPAGEILASGPANGTTGLTALETLTAGQTLSLGSETLEPVASNPTISGTVQTSPAGANPTAAAGVSVTLLGAAGTALASTTTDARGNFQFANLTAGTYTVQYTPPAGSVPELGGAADGVSGDSAPITLSAGQNVTLPTEELLTNPATVSGPVTFMGNAYWYMPGLTVDLLSSTGQLVAGTQTSDGGIYSFLDVAAGTYQLHYVLPSNAQFYGGYENRTTGLSSPFTLVAGQNAVEYNVGVEAIVGALVQGTVLYQAPGLAAAAQAGATVSLLNPDGSVLTSTTTNSAGLYQFKFLLAGPYQIEYSLPSGDSFLAGGPAAPTTGLASPFTLAVGQSLTVAAETLVPIQHTATLAGTVTYGGTSLTGETVALIGTGGATLATTTTDAQGAFAFSGLAAGSYELDYTDPAGDLLASGPATASTGLTAWETLAAGQTLTVGTETLEPLPATLLGSVQTSPAGSNPAPAAGVPITLLNEAGTAVANTTTDSNGRYQFANLAPGAYSVQFTPASGSVLELGGPADVVSGQSATVSLVVGQTVSLPTEQLLTNPATISGPVTFQGGAYWYMPGLNVNLLSSSGQLVASTVTSDSGIYSFGDVAAGTYQLQYVLPGNARFYSGYENTTTGLSNTFTLAGGQNFSEYNVGVAAVVGAIIQGTVDTQAVGGAPMAAAGVTVSLLNPDGSVLTSTTTTNAGLYQFKFLLAGPYQVAYSLPSGDSFAAGGPADPSTGLTSPINLAQGQVVTEAAQILQLVQVVQAQAQAGPLALVATQDDATTGSIGGGSDTINVTGEGNVINAGPGMNFITSDGSAGDVFYLNGSGQGTTTISGFNTLGDVLDLVSTVAGTSIASGMANLGNTLSARIAGGNTILSVDPTGSGGTPYAFAVLNGVTTSVAELIATHAITLA